MVVISSPPRGRGGGEVQEVLDKVKGEQFNLPLGV